jgi:hypothetical protein
MHRKTKKTKAKHAYVVEFYIPGDKTWHLCLYEHDHYKTRQAAEDAMNRCAVECRHRVRRIKI